MEQVRIGHTIYTRQDKYSDWTPDAKMGGAGTGRLAKDKKPSIRAAKRANRGNMTPCLQSAKQLPPAIKKER